MKIRAYNFFPILVMILLAGLTTWLQHATRLEVEGADGKHRHDPDFFAENFDFKSFNAEGEQEYGLRGSYMEHFPDDDSTEIQRPQIKLLRGNAPVDMTAKFGRVTQDGEKVVLHDDVLVVRAPFDDQPETRLKTDQLTAYPEDDLAETQAPATLYQGKSVIHAGSMRLDNLRSNIELVGGVKAEIEKRRSK